ncbi:MAG: NlpC/P60 family protein [Actinomycetaceae bacterium]|nr:NlpC/P60 family protein [Actinomycetaceae bacterium]
MQSRRNTPWRIRALIAALVAGFSLSTPGLAAATPSADDFTPMDEYERMSIAQMEVELARVTAAKDDADIQLSIVGEELARAQQDLEDAQVRLAEAQEEANEAAQERDAARDQLASVAQTAYRSGSGSLDRFAPYLQTDGLAEVQRKAAILDKFSHDTDFQLQQVVALDQVARGLEEQAKESEAQVSAAKVEVEQREQLAQTAAIAAENQVTEVQQRRTALIAQLAERRNVLIAEEEARQERIQAEQRRRQEAAERARVEREQQQVAQAEARRQAEAAAQAEANRQQSAERDQRPATPAPAPKPTPPSNSSRGAAVVAWAETKLGVPYVWGGNGYLGYDCSGLAQNAWASQGVRLPRVAADQYWATRRVAISDLQPGDLVFWGRGGGTAEIYHVAIYAGNGQMIEAPRPGLNVKYSPLRYQNLLPYGGRP